LSWVDVGAGVRGEARTAEHQQLFVDRPATSTHQPLEIRPAGVGGLEFDLSEGT
jgi:hypothetical protein